MRVHTLAKKLLIAPAVWIVLSAVSSVFLSAQIPGHLIPDRYIDPNKGNIIYTKKGIMDGNLVRTLYLNHGEIALWPDSPSGEWPKGTGQQYIDGVAIIVQARVPANHPSNLEGRDIFPLQTNYREFIRKDPVTGVPWGWAPLPGYANQAQNQPALSNNPSTWPAAWPDRSSDWDGLWNGYFGRGIFNAQLETYFRMDDSQDKQYRFLPDPDDNARGGLGMQVAVRGLQWNNVLAQDVMFWLYEITNVGKTNYEETLFAQYVDWGIGGTEDSHDDAGAWDKELDIAYAWDLDGRGLQSGVPWGPVGVAGYAFLESPGLINGMDNDWDGIIDESRYNDAGTLIEGRENIIAYMEANYDMERFFRFYNIESYDDIAAIQQEYWWTGDENANWRGFTDLNGNGIWDNGEPLNDDVGSDGLSPFDEGYTGPTPDGTQGNARPDQGEPNFGILDPFESNQIGLTGFAIFPVHFYELINDDQNWEVLSRPIDWDRPVEQLVDVNLGMYFSSGARRMGNLGGTLFPMPPLHTERFSMALLFGMNRDDLFRRTRTIRQIYNAGYRFAEPPDKPTLVAVPGDGKVTLYWDEIAESSFDRFLQEHDFEGYKVYRSTEPSFIENMVITDAYGAPIYRKPIAQFDLKNGIRGLHPIDIQGVKYNLGEDTGLQHTFIDTDVQNGQKYYYAVVSYDYGFVTTTRTGDIEGIPPSECTAIIDVDVSGNVRTDINTAVVVPRAPAAGYVPPQLDGGIMHTGPGTGSISVTMLNPNEIVDGNVYRVMFNNYSHFQNSPDVYYSFYDVSKDTLIVEDRLVTVDGEETPIVDGLIGYIYNETEVNVDLQKTGWTGGNSAVSMNVGLSPRYSATNVRYPADFEIRFTSDIADTSLRAFAFPFQPPATPVNFTVWNVTEDKKAKFYFFGSDPPNFTPGDSLVILYGDSLGKDPVSGGYRTTWAVRMIHNDNSGSTPALPASGDVYRFSTTKPFRTDEAFQFHVKAAEEDKEQAKSVLDQIAVVPNPYVGAASWEEALRFRSGRGERKIYFIHLPRRCTIRIYTISGHHVHTLEHDSTIDDGQIPWNLLSKDGMDIAYGVYIYHVDAPGIGEKIGRFAVIK
jgi:hypothetical protein